MHFGNVWIEFDRLAVVCYRAVVIPDDHSADPSTVKVRGVGGIELDRLAEIVDGTFMVVLGRPGESASGIIAAVFWLDRDRAAIVGYSNRVAMGIDDAVRSLIALKGAKGKRLLYRDSAEA